jgi:hypothetical protein
VVATLNDAEAVGDKGRIGITGVGRRVAAGAVVVGERADWLTNTPPVRLMDSATLLRQVAAVIASITSGLVL